jgi:hypothetical protein
MEPTCQPIPTTVHGPTCQHSFPTWSACGGTAAPRTGSSPRYPFLSKVTGLLLHELLYRPSRLHPVRGASPLLECRAGHSRRAPTCRCHTTSPELSGAPTPLLPDATPAPVRLLPSSSSPSLLSLGAAKISLPSHGLELPSFGEEEQCYFLSVLVHLWTFKIHSK